MSLAIFPGQVYLNTELNEYLIITKNKHSYISYSGIGFKGKAENFVFINKFEPVNPIDIDSSELDKLLKFCSKGIKASIGFLGDKNEDNQ